MTHLIKSLTGASVLVISICTSAAHAGGAATHSGQSFQHSAQAVGHLSVGTVKTAAGIVAVPLEVVSKTGELSGQAAGGLWDYANEPLPIGNEIITAGPSPDEMF